MLHLGLFRGFGVTVLGCGTRDELLNMGSVRVSGQ